MDIPTLRMQSTLETLYSGHNVRWILGQAIERELNDTLFNWSLAAASKLDIYLNKGYDDGYTQANGKPFKSKNERIKKLKPWLAEHGLDHLLVCIAAAVMQAGKAQTYQQVIGALARAMPHTHDVDAEKTAAELIAMCSSATPGALYAIYPQGPGRMTLIDSPHWGMLSELFQAEWAWINETGFNPPLTEPPLPVRNNKSNGYYTISVPVLSGGRLKQHDKKLNLSCINVLNSIAWRIDPDVLAEQEEIPDDFEPLQQQTHEQFMRDSERIYQILGDQPFWLAWQYDFRGRVYSHGYHVNLQSYEYKKALLNLDKAEYLA